MPDDARDASFFATASRGTEAVLGEELAALGIRRVLPGRGGVAFGERLEDGYRACLWSRIASRVLLPLARFEARNAAELYAGAREVDWTLHVGPERTLAVAVAGAASPAGPAHFLALKTKDAIVDTVRDAEGSRPNVDKRRPDVSVHVHTAGTVVTLSLDLAGRGLHHRGLGRVGASAPLRETLAAALLRMAGWPDRCVEAPLFDPLCGSATLLVEAAAFALDVAPGLARGRIGAEGWRGHAAALWTRLREEARERGRAARRRPLRIAGADASAETIELARAVLGAAGLAERVRVEVADLHDARPPWDGVGLLVTNPPYGMRIGEAGELGPLYQTLGDTLRRRFPGWSAWVLSGNRALDKRIGLRPAARHVVFNGPIECRWLEFPISETPVAGNDGPRWRGGADEARGFAKRLADNARRLDRWAAREGLTAYRLYDSDVPEYNLAVDRYADHLRVEEYERPRRIEAETAERRLHEALGVVSDVLGVEPRKVVLRVRRRLAPGEQHPRYAAVGRRLTVQEQDLRFFVNLTDYVDTGLFLDDRLLRRRLRERAAERRLLNLFAYTCAVSVAAACGGARSTTNVDLSRRYLDWGRENYALNGLRTDPVRFVRADVSRFLAQGAGGLLYDEIHVGPPSRSRSKGMSGEFDVQRDHPALLDAAARHLAPGGEIVFATNLRGFEPDLRVLGAPTAVEITESITPADFARRPRLRAWSIRPRDAAVRR